MTFPALLLLTLLTWAPPAFPFTVILPDSGTPSSALVDAPQTGFSMKRNGARTDPREQEAVYEIMKATGNQWATEIPDVCQGRWHGIECMPDKDDVYHVVSLSFGALSDDTAFPTCDEKHASISSHVTKLPHLRTLFFYRCFGTSNPQPIPTFLGQLGPTLQTLVLRENGHVGPIPNELGNLTHLRVLDLHSNNLNGSIPISLGRLTGLRSLDLSGNRLMGQVPNFSFSDLNILDLSQNLLIGPIPSRLTNSVSLIKMDLSRNRLSGPIPDSIGNLNSLILMDLSYNQLSGPIPVAIGNMNSLQALILKGNQMDSTTIPANGFDGLKDLLILILSDMSLQGPIPESLGRLPSIRVIHLDQNSLNGSIPRSLQDLKELRELRLNDNQLTGRVPFSKEMVWKMGRKLRVNNNSGLCYDPSSGLEESPGLGTGSGFSFSSIGYCESTPAPTKATMHMSTAVGHGSKPDPKSSAPGHDQLYVRLHLFLLFLCFFVYLS